MKRKRKQRQSKRSQRQRTIDKISNYLNHASTPRIQMTVIVMITGAAGFFCSFGLLQAGVYSMWLRYGISVLGAYLVFLFLIWLWLQTVRYWSGFNPDFDLADGLNAYPAGNTSSSHKSNTASEGQDASDGQSSSAGVSAKGNGSSGGSSSGGIDIDASSDEGTGFIVILVVVLVAVVAAVVAAGYVVYSAPTLFAEILLDGVLSYGLLRRLNKLDQTHWLETTFLRTRFPVFWVLLFFCLAGWVMQWYVPEAASIGAVWDHFFKETS